MQIIHIFEHYLKIFKFKLYFEYFKKIKHYLLKWHLKLKYYYLEETQLNYINFLKYLFNYYFKIFKIGDFTLKQFYLMTVC